MRTETFDTARPIQLDIEIRSGSVHIAAQEGLTQTVVEIEGEHADQVVLEQQNDSLWIDTPKARGLGSDREWAIDLRISTPAHGGVMVASGSAPVTTEGPVRAVRIKAGSGNIDLDESEAETLVDTGSGRIAVRRATGDTRLRTGSGGVDAGALDGEAMIATGSGHASVASLNGSLGYKAGSGDLRIEQMRGELKARTGSGRITIDHLGHGEVDAKTGSGDVTVQVPAGTPVWTDILSGRPVESTLPSAGEPAPGQDHVKLSARTGSGVVRLRPAEPARATESV